MIQIRPVSDLRNKFPEIETIVNSGKPVFLTKNGYGAMVVLSLEEYASLTDSIEMKLDEADRQAAMTEERLSHASVFGNVKSAVNGKYQEICRMLQGLIQDVPYLTANLANASALLYQELRDLNWAGFYLMEKDRLVLGPFQGRPACIEIPVGKGVCGTAAARDEIMLVKNVHEFPGHIACDAASNSEIVLPIHKDGRIVGVLDIDSPVIARFTEDDRDGLEQFVQILEEIF